MQYFIVHTDGPTFYGSKGQTAKEVYERESKIRKADRKAGKKYSHQVLYVSATVTGAPLYPPQPEKDQSIPF